MRNEMTIEMACPPGAVFPYIEDNDKLPLWFSGFVVAHWTSAAHTFRHVLEFGGRMLPMTGRVLAREQDRHLSMQLESDVASMTVDYRLVPEGTGTRLTYSCDSQLKGFVRRMFTPVVSWAVQRKIRRDLTRLKEVAETAA
jgi:carbon monoxide dehydrogenase subunit G